MQSTIEWNDRSGRWNATKGNDSKARKSDPESRGSQFNLLHSSSNFGNHRKSHQSLEQATFSRRCRARAKHCGRINQLCIRRRNKTRSTSIYQTLPHLRFFLKLPIYLQLQKLINHSNKIKLQVYFLPTKQYCNNYSICLNISIEHT